MPAAAVSPPAPPAEPPPAARPAADLVAPRAQEQTSAALGELVRTVRQEKQRSQMPQRSPLEALVLEALRPSLKAWLEQNLAPLVERVVREEVRRLTRRVEDQ
jgi:cell pole-organizing protein PopZ